MITDNSTARDCFGFFGGDSHTTCMGCPAKQRCKALLVSDVFPIMGELIDTLIAEIPGAANFKNTNSIPEMVDELINPVSTPLSKEEEELLDLVISTGRVKTSDLGIDNI